MMHKSRFAALTSALLLLGLVPLGKAQPVSGLVAGQILDHRLDRRGLIRSFLEGKPFGKSLVIMRTKLEGMTLPRRALRVEIQQFRRGVAHLPERPGLGALPLAAAQRMQRRVVGRSSAITADQMQAADRHVQLGVVGVTKMQKLRWPVAQIQRHQAEITADAVLLVDHRIADPDLGQIAQHGLDIAALATVALGEAPGIGGIEFGLGDDE